MIFYIILFLIILFICLLIIFINYMFSLKVSLNREKITPFECGFDPLSDTRLPFSIQFFLIGLMFLIFDIEIILLIPVVFLFNYFLSFSVMLLLLIFILFLLVGLWMEWLISSLDWVF